MDGLDDRMGRVQTDLQAVLRGLAELKTEAKSVGSPRPNDGKCFHCGGLGHFARNCPKKTLDNKPAGDKNVTFEPSSLNGKEQGK